MQLRRLQRQWATIRACLTRSACAGVQAVQTAVSLREGMALYGLQDAQLFIEPFCDTKMLMAWSRNTIVMAFRGTASRKAAFYDLQACLHCTWLSSGSC